MTGLQVAGDFQHTTILLNSISRANPAQNLLLCRKGKTIKARVIKGRLILERNDKTKEAATEHRRLARDTQNKNQGLLMGIRERAVKYLPFAVDAVGVRRQTRDVVAPQCESDEGHTRRGGPLGPRVLSTLIEGELGVT